MKILINQHSFIDVITNSSSELFVCNTTKSLDFIKTFLQSALNTYNLSNDTTYTFDECFGEIYEITNENIDDFLDTYVIGWGFHDYSWGCLPLISSYDFKSKYMRENNLVYAYPFSDKLNKTRNEEIDKTCMDKWNKLEQEWKRDNLQHIKEKVLTNILIHSKDDNSIPYELFDLIEKTLNGNRIHLG